MPRTERKRGPQPCSGSKLYLTAAKPGTASSAIGPLPPPDAKDYPTLSARKKVHLKLKGLDFMVFHQHLAFTEYHQLRGTVHSQNGQISTAQAEGCSR